MKKRNLAPLMTSNKQDWATPRPFVKYVENYLGHKFTLDLAADSKNKVCVNYISEHRDFLSYFSLDTRALCWCNPPYNQTEKFVEQIIKQRLATVLLIPSRTDTKYFHKAFQEALFVRFIKGRIRFKGADIGAPFPSVLFFLDGYRNSPISSKYWKNFKGKPKVDVWDLPTKTKGW